MERMRGRLQVMRSSYLALGVFVVSIGLVASPLNDAVSAQVPLPRYRAIVEKEIGDLDGPVALMYVRSMVAVEDRFYIAQASIQEIRVLTRDGVPVARWGGHGGGPGEYLAASTVYYVDGELVVVDQLGARLTYLDLEGRVSDTRPFPKITDRPPYSFYYPVFPATGRQLLIFGANMTSRPLPAYDERQPGLVVDASGEVVDELWYRFGQQRVYVEDDRGDFSRPYPLQDRSYMAMAPNGRFFVVADHRGDDEGLYLARRNFATGETDTLCLDLPRVRVPPAYADSVERAFIENEPALVERFGLRKVRETVRSPERIPAADALFVTNEGEVWLRQPNFGPGPDRWLVVSPEGSLAAQVEVPKGRTLLTKNGRDLWAHHQDAYLVSYLSRLRLEPVGEPQAHSSLVGFYLRPAMPVALEARRRASGGRVVRPML